MKLQEAIEIGKALLDGTYDHRDETMENGLRILIEAGKREEYHRSCYPNQSPDLLPGETK